jgi:LPXTG-motif cell wall-anchored protein
MSNNAQSTPSAQSPSSDTSNAAAQSTPSTSDTQGATATNDQATSSASTRRGNAANQGNLPQTASDLPFVGLLGLGLLAAGLVSGRKAKRGIRTI